MTLKLHPDALADWLARHHPAAGYVLAYSGGLDSHVLLHLCARLAHADRRYAFRALHVHHGLQSAADAWPQHCAAVCAALGVPFKLLRVDARAAPGQSPEEAARLARYGALSAALRAGEALLTAQHADDQAETLLLQLLRGAGLPGLAAMPAVAAFGTTHLLRPLLSVSRTDLVEYAQAQHLHWIEDPSNRDSAFDRNYLRQNVLPLLTARWPSAAHSLSRAARHCAEAQQQLERLADDLLLQAEQGDAETTLVTDVLRQWAAHEQRLVLRRWLNRQGFRAPATRVLQRVVDEVLTAAPARNPLVSWPEGSIRRYRQRLYALPPLPAFDASTCLNWAAQTPLTLPGNGVLHGQATHGVGVRADWIQSGNCTVRYRQGGERCRLPGRHGQHTLKKLLQESAVPPWWRDRLPLLYLDDQLAAVADVWVCAPFAATADQPAVRLSWQKPV